MATSALPPFHPDAPQGHGAFPGSDAHRLEVVPRKGSVKEMHAPQSALAEELLTADALSFLSNLHRRFEPQREQLLSRRAQRQAGFDSGHFPDFLYGTRHVRQMEWRVTGAPIRGRGRALPLICVVGHSSEPTEGVVADTLADMHDVWSSSRRGQAAGEGSGFNISPMTTWVRSRGLQALEKNVDVPGATMSAALFDIGLHCLHASRLLMERGAAPAFYLSGIEGHEEARWWNEMLARVEQQLTLPQGSIQVIAAIDTLTAAFEMEEILYELRERCAGLAFGRESYLASYIRVFRKHPEFMLPESDGVTMDHPLLRAALDLMVHCSHKRGALALGPLSDRGLDGDACGGPASERFYLDKLRDARAGCDGFLVGDAGHASIARAAFAEEQKWARVAPSANDHSHISARDLLAVPNGAITAEGLRRCVRASLDHLAARIGVESIHALAQPRGDAAKADLARMQVRQWLQGCARLEDGRAITRHLLEDMAREAAAQESSAASPLAQAQYVAASRTFLRWCCDDGDLAPMADA